MPKRILTPKQSLLKGYMTLPVSKEAVSVFKEEMRTLADRIKTEESEEYNKNLIMQFLNRAYYAKQGCMVNTYGKMDMAIYNDGEDGRRPVVLFEFKGPGRPDMISTECFRKKALYELVLYYLREEIKNANHDIKHLVITDCQQFFIFEKSLFYSLFAKNKKLVKAVLEADDNRNDRTEYIYNELIAPEVALVEDRMTCTYLNLQEFKHDIKNGVKGISPKLIAAYKILSPVHLMRLTFSSDHNTLNAKFYQELLYIMGLQEVAGNKKKVISRLDDPDRQHYSLLEQAYGKLSDYDDITDPQQRFDSAIGLTLLWVNRSSLNSLNRNWWPLMLRQTTSSSTLRKYRITTFSTIFFGKYWLNLRARGKKEHGHISPTYPISTAAFLKCQPWSSIISPSVASVPAKWTCLPKPSSLMPTATVSPDRSTNWSICSAFSTLSTLARPDGRMRW